MFYSLSYIFSTLIDKYYIIIIDKLVCNLQWSEILEMDISDVEDELEKRIDNIHANDCCVLVYTVSDNLILNNNLCENKTLPPNKNC